MPDEWDAACRSSHQYTWNITKMNFIQNRWTRLQMYLGVGIFLHLRTSIRSKMNEMLCVYSCLTAEVKVNNKKKSITESFHGRNCIICARNLKANGVTQKMDMVPLSQEQVGWCLFFFLLWCNVNTPNKLKAGVSLPHTVEWGGATHACCRTRYIMLDKSIPLSALTRSRTEVQIYGLLVV